MHPVTSTRSLQTQPIEDTLSHSFCSYNNHMGRENVKVTAIYSTYSVVYKQELSADSPHSLTLALYRLLARIKIPLSFNVNPDLVSRAGILYPRTDHLIRDRRINITPVNAALDVIDIDGTPLSYACIL